MLLTLRYQADRFIASAGTRPITAIYFEADPLHNLRLVRQALSQASTVAVLVSRNTQALLAPLRAEAQRLGLILKVINAEQDEEAVRNLRREVDRIDALLLLPDTQLINDWSLKPILLMTVRRFIPVFGGVSDRYVQSGVTAAVVAALDRVAAQVKTAVDQRRQGVLPPSGYPDGYRTVINPVVSRSLSIDTTTWGADDGQP